MKAVLPENFDLQDHIARYPPERSDFSCFDPGCALYILSQITMVPIRNKDVEEKMEDGYTPLCSARLQPVIRNYNNYLIYFIETCVIETNNQYFPETLGVKGQCKGYRFVKEYSKSAIMPMAYSGEFEKRLVKRRKAHYQKLRKEYGHLTKWLWPDCRLEIDAETAMRFLELRRTAQLERPELRDKKKPNGFSFDKLGKPQVKDPEEQYRYALVGVNCLQNGDIGCTVDSTVGRMHTVLTNLKSDLRNLITYGGEPLVSIDITNSQPYLATVLTDPEFYEESPAKRRYIKQITLKSLTKDQESNKDSLILVKLRQLFDNEDFNLYRQLVSKAGDIEPDLYEYMRQECSKHGMSFSDRGEVKEGVFEMLFSKNKHGTKAKKLFSELFPSVDEIFRTIKEGNHARLPILLQRIEAEIVLKVISREISKKNPKIPMFTIHDSITTTEQYVTIVEQVMIKELTKLTGLPPKLKKEKWTPENLNWEKYKGGI